MLIKSGNKANSPLKPLNILAGILILAGVIVLIIQSQSKESAKVKQDGAAFQLAGQEYLIDNLPHRYRQQYYEIANQAFLRQQTILQTAATEIYINQQMQENNETRESVVKRLFNPVPPTPQQIEAFYHQNRGRINAPLPQAQNQIALLLMSQQQQLKQKELLNNLQQLGEYQPLLAKPEAPIITVDTLDYPSKGAENAKVTLIEFGDYQCPHCRQSFEELAQLWPEYKDKVKFIYMDFPINRSGISRKVAEGAYCAQQQGEFWAFHDLAFKNQSVLSNEISTKFAEELSLDLDKFSACLADEATAKKIEDSAKQAVQSGITGTPAFFLNGIKLSDIDKRQGLRKLLDQAIAASDDTP